MTTSERTSDEHSALQQKNVINAQQIEDIMEDVLWSWQVERGRKKKEGKKQLVIGEEEEVEDVV